MFLKDWPVTMYCIYIYMAGCRWHPPPKTHQSSQTTWGEIICLFRVSRGGRRVWIWSDGRGSPTHPTHNHPPHPSPENHRKYIKLPERVKFFPRTPEKLSRSSPKPLTRSTTQQTFQKSPPKLPKSAKSLPKVAPQHPKGSQKLHKGIPKGFQNES